MVAPASASRSFAAYREGKRLAISRAMPGVSDAAALPDLCVKCGEPAAGTITHRFSWSPRWIAIFILLGVLPYVLLSLALAKRMRVKVPLCAAHHLRRRIQFLIGLALMVGGTASFIVVSATHVDVGAWVLAATVSVVLGILVTMRSRPIAPTEIDEGGGTFSGAGEAYLSKLS